MKSLLCAAALLALGACATSAPLTSAQCAQKQAALSAAQKGLPALETAVAASLSPQQAADSALALNAAEALIALDQGYIASECAAG